MGRLRRNERQEVQRDMFGISGEPRNAKGSCRSSLLQANLSAACVAEEPVKAATTNALPRDGST